MVKFLILVVDKGVRELEMLGNLVRIIQLTIFIMMAACLPQEKTTQCGSGEAYNATQRRCVATAVKSTQSISITSITPTSSYALSASDPSVTHSINVSDPFNLGFTVKWNLKQPNGSNLLVGTGLSYTFVHTAFSTGSYILEVLVYDSSGTAFIDSRSWTINLMTETTPSITAVTPNPQMTTTTATSPLSLQATLSNPDAISVTYKWYVNGVVTTDTGSFSSTSVSENFSFDPTSSATYHAGAGTYSVQLVLENGSGIQYDSFVWTVQNNIPGFTTVSLGNDINGNTTPAPSSILTIIDEADFNPAVGKGVRYNHSSITAGELDAADVCITVADYEGVDGSGVAVDFLMNGVAIPNAYSLTYTSDGQTICMGQTIAANGGTYSIDIPSTIQVESRTITAVVYDKFAGVTTQPSYNGGAEIARYNWTARVRQKNAAPVVTIDSTNTDMDATGTYPTYTCASQSSTTYSNCEIKQDNQLVVAINVSDDADGDGVQDYDPAVNPERFQVEFFVDSMIADGDTLNTTGAAAKHIIDEDCKYEYADGTGAALRYKCTLEINSYDEDGPVFAPGPTYQLSARVKDLALAGYGGGESSYSNVVTWDISTVNYSVDTLTLSDFGTVNGTNSRVTNASNTELVETGTAVAENDVVYFYVRVDDPQRDSHKITVKRCTDNTCVSEVTVATKVVNSTDATNPRTSVIAHQVSQDAVTGAATAQVYYRVIVEGNTPDDAATEQTDDDTFWIQVNNYNPAPTYAGNYNPAQNTIPTALIGFSGFPITVDPGTITDTSLADGENISYQWMVAVDSDNDGVVTDENYEAIPGADQRILTWAPGPEINVNNNTGQLVAVRLCIGDDGYDNGLGALRTPGNNVDPLLATDCLQASQSSGDWYVKVYSNMYKGQSAVATAGDKSSGEVAVWIDPSTTDPIVKYMAYVNLNKEIVVEKYVTTATTAAKGGSVAKTVTEISSVVFPSTTDAFYSSNDVTNLSIAGDTTNKALYIAYMAPVASVDIVHIRRIDLRSGKTGLAHQGTFGWDRGYDDLTNNFNPGPGLSEAVNASGKLEITVTQSGDSQSLMNLQLTNSYGVTTTLSNNVDFCTGSCSTTTATASSIASAINAATGAGFQGVTASASGAVVTLDGIYEDDYLQIDIGATTIGQIMVNKTAGQWQLAYIDHTRSGSDKHKPHVFRGDLGTRLVNSNHYTTFLSNANVNQAEEITNDIYESDPDGDGTSTGNDRIIIATRRKSTGEIDVYEYASNLGAGVPIEYKHDVFSDTDVNDIKLKVSQNSTNPAAYLVGRNSGDALAYARFNHTTGNFSLAAGSSTVVLNLDNDWELIENNNATYFDIAPGALQYQLFIAAVDSVNNTAYLATVSGGTPVIDCSYDSDQDLNKCMKLTGNWHTANTVDKVFDLPVALGRVLEDVTIGNAGATTGENTNDVLPVVFHTSAAGAAGVAASDALPLTGLLNVTSINLSGNDQKAGQVHAIPYVND